jgi:Mn2+/Fe2+ NRAMP family transporter
VKNKISRSALSGAAFLMAMSSVGPGFLTQTTVFTEKLLASFGFVILLSVILDIFAQLNIWRVISVSRRHAQDLANDLVPNLGYLLTFLIVMGGLAFNIGNVAGAGLGLQVLFGIDVITGAIISAAIAIMIFVVKEAGKAMDNFSKILAFVKISLILYVVYAAHPPIFEALHHTILPERFDAFSTITLVGGTVGGYITFAGVHRLLDAGISGKENLPEINKAAVQGILLTALIRFLLFFAAFGVVSMGLKLSTDNPPASVFQLAAGNVGYKIFGIVLWAAGMTSTVGSAFTSISFVRTFHPMLEKYHRQITVGFIAFSTFIFMLVGKPIKILVMVGTLNGLILPISLGIILVASRKIKLMGTYKHPISLQILGWFVVILMAGMAVKSFL